MFAKHQKPFYSVFSIGKKARWVFTGKLVINLYKKFVSVGIQHRGMLKNTRTCNHFQRLSNAVFILKN